MAEKRSIFLNILDAMKGNKKSLGRDLAQDKSLLTGQPIGAQREEMKSIQRVQQDFLDVQSQKIAFDIYARSVYYDTERITAYSDYRAMDLSPEVSAAMDIIADETCTRGESGSILSIYSENSRIKSVLKDLFFKVINIDYNLWFWTRETIKFGDTFLYLEIDGDNKKGIYDVRMLPVSEIHREDGWDGKMNSSRFRWDLNNMYFEEWQMAHFRIIGDGSKLPYGRSILSPARKLWKQLQLCLAKDTRVWTPTGYREIQDIKEGDEVYSFNSDTKNLIKTTVKKCWKTGDDRKLYKVKSRYSEIEVTDNHPIMVYDGENVSYKNILEIDKEKDKVINPNINFGDLKGMQFEEIQSIEYVRNDEVWDLEVNNDLHNFIANGIVVHNSEDAMLVYRIVRAPDRRVFYIEVGNIENNDVKQYIEEVKRELKKAPVVDAKTGNMNLKYDVNTVEEDLFIPIRGDKASRVETLNGPSNLNDIADIEYLQNKLFAALKVPKTYLNYSESLPGGSMLSQADLRFSRTINRIQETMLSELRRIANIHLYFMGFKDDLDNFDLKLTNPSTQQELLKLETMKARLEVFKDMVTGEPNSPVSYTWAMENIMGLSKSEIKQILRQKKIEKKLFSEIEATPEEYKETGLFFDLDKKYKKKLPKADDGSSAETVETPESQEGGGLELPPSDESPTGMGSETAIEAPEATEETPIEQPEAQGETLAENSLFGMMLNENSNKEINGDNRKESNLLSKNKSVFTNTKKLIENIDQRITKANSAINFNNILREAKKKSEKESKLE